MAAIIKAVLEVLVNFLERQAAKPKPIEDANTPQTVRDRWAAYLRRKLQKPGGGD